MSHLSEQGLPVTGDLPPYLADLNKEQFEAATHIYGPELILSGAGTGKTKTLVARVSYLLDQNIDPENILLLTFMLALRKSYTKYPESV